MARGCRSLKPCEHPEDASDEAGVDGVSGSSVRTSI